MAEQPILVVRPSRWNFFWHYVFFWLVVPLAIVFIERRKLRLKIFDDRVVLEMGILSKDSKVIFISDIRTIDVQQSFIQRIFTIGDILIATSGTAGYESDAKGMPDPVGIKDLIMGLRSGDEEEIDDALEELDDDDGAPLRTRRRKWLNEEKDLDW